MIRLIAYALIALIYAASVTADVRLSQPIANQLPPIAYVDEPFTFTLSSTTFAFADPAGSTAPPSPPSILYTVSDLPKWLTFDSNTLTFTGSTPTSDDGRRFSIPVTGTLQQGAPSLGGNTSATDYLSLVVLDDPAPTVNVPIAQQFPKASSLGPKYMAAPTTIHLPLGWSFSIGLRGDTFAISTGANVYWSVSLEGGQPLPSWLIFSEDSYDFYGVAPTDVGPQGLSLTVVVTGSNRPAHGGATQTFTLEVSPQTLALPNGLANVNASVGTFLQIPIPVDGLQIDGAVLNSTSAVTVTANIPTTLSWLTFTESNRTLTGIVPFTPYGNASTSTTVQVPLVFNNGNGTLLTVMQSIVISPSAFTALVLPNVFMTKGSEVSVSLAQYVRNATKTASRRSVSKRAPATNNIQTAFTPTNASQWLTYDQNSLTLAGRVPEDWSNRVKVDLTAAGAQGASSASQASFYLAFAGDSPIGNPSPNAGRNTSSGNQNSKGLSHHKKVIIGASLGAAAGLALLILLLCCCRKRDADEEVDRSRIRSPDRDDDEGTLTDKGKQWKKAIVVGRAGVGEVRTPSTIAVSPMPGFDGQEKVGEKNEASPTHVNDLHSVVVVSPNGRRRDVMLEAEAPMQSRLIANLFTGGRAHPPEHRRTKATANKAGLGLSLGDVDPTDPFAGPDAETRGGIRHVRSRESVNSHRSSWESDLFYEDAPSTQQHHSGDGQLFQGGNGEEGEDVPRRRGKNLNVRHRATHNNGSPAFVTPDVFAPSPLPTVESNGQSLDRIGMSAVDSGLSAMSESQDAHAIANGGRQEDARILKARIMQVQRHSPILHQGSRSPMLPQVASARPYDTSNGAGAFDDAEDDEASMGHTNGSPAGKGKTRGNKNGGDARKRNSTLSAVTVGSQHTAKNRATAEVMPSPDPSISAFDPRETVRTVARRPQTPPLQKIGAATNGGTPRTPKRSVGTPGSSGGGAASGMYLPCPMVNATIGYLLRFRLYPNVPPPMAGAPSSPGKRSGRSVRYELVMDDNRPHLAKYKGQWPAMLADWLDIDTTTFEVEGVVPRATELEQLGDCDIALVSTTRISGNSPDKRNSMASYDSRVSADDGGGEERTVVARAKLIFQNAAPRGFVPRHGQAF